MAKTTGPKTTGPCRLGRSAAALGAFVLLVGCASAGCASIPDAGPVNQGREITFRQQDAYVRRLAQPPAPGASREAIARGFLVAAGDFDYDHAVARAYLTPAVAASWAADQSVRIYKEATLRLTPWPNNEFVASAELVGTIDADGAYTRAPPGIRMKSSIRLGQVDGEWRIVGLDPGLLLTNGDVERAYREVNLYFLDMATRTRLVPDPVLLPIRQGLATSVVQALLRGPTSRLRGAVVSQFPAGAQLADRVVPVANGVVDVDLTGPAREAEGQQRALLSAQLVWTLRALPDVRAVRITVNNEEYAVPGVPEQQSRDAWQAMAPDVIGPDSPLYAIADGRLVILPRPAGHKAVTPMPLRGEAGSGRLRIVDPAISITGGSTSGGDVAGLSADRRVLSRGSLMPDEAFIRVLEGVDLSEPSWDAGGGLWIVDRTPGGPVVQLFTGTVGVRVEAAELGAKRVRYFRIARDGARAAVVVDEGARRSRLYVGRVERSGGPPRLAGLQPIGRELIEFGQIAWQDADHVVVLARKGDGSAVQPYIVDIDGRPAEATVPLAGVTSIAAAPGGQLFASATRGRVWQFDGEAWQRIGVGTDLAFPG
jgi:hypothetical protein